MPGSEANPNRARSTQRRIAEARASYGVQLGSVQFSSVQIQGEVVRTLPNRTVPLLWETGTASSNDATNANRGAVVVLLIGHVPDI